MHASISISLRRLGAAMRFYTASMVRRLLRKTIELIITDLDLMAGLRDLWSSVAFEEGYLSEASTFKSRTQLQRWVAEQSSDEGLHLEFGVYKGDSINGFADLKRHVTWYGFDTFTGLPENWSLGAKARAFDIGGKLPPVRPNVRLIKGNFTDTLPAFVARHRGSKIALLHVDCDLYSSTKTVLTELKGMLGPGSIILFDELINYPNWQQHEHRAFMEYVAEQNVSFQYIGYIRTSSQVAVRLIEAPAMVSAQPAALPA